MSVSGDLIPTVEAALVVASSASSPARFALLAADEASRVVVAAQLLVDLAPLAPMVQPLSALDVRLLLLAFPGRRLGPPEACFQAAYSLADAFALDGVEPDLATDLFPVADPAPTRFRAEGFDDFPPWCWAPEQPELRQDPLWALRQIRVPDAWAFSRQSGRPVGGQGVLIAQPDTGIAAHAELAGLDRAPSHDFVDGDDDPTDPLDYGGNPGHGTGTASVAVAPGRLNVCGTAPAARLMPIRAIESVVRISQVAIAEAIDFAVIGGAQVITMSLGGLPSMSLNRALRRAVAADVIVVAAAGNCVGEVVFPARYADCIAVGGTDWKNRPWRGSCRGEAVAVSAPGENVFRARVSRGTVAPGTEFGQGQGTSFAVAMVAGVAAVWLAHHGRANLIAAARANTETLQVMFRRLLQATARRPVEWDAFAMGAGVVDTLALLQADLQLGRDRVEFVAGVGPSQPDSAPIRSLLVATFDEAGDPPGLDWARYGQELAYAAFRERFPDRPTVAWQTEAPTQSRRLSPGLRSVLADTALDRRLSPAPTATALLGLEVAHSDTRGGAAALSGPFASLLAREVRRDTAGMRSDPSGFEGGALLTPGAHPDDVLGQIEDVLGRMPDNEVPDPAAFRRALTLLLREGEGPIRRYVTEPQRAPSPADRMALEAVIQTDGTRPSLMLRDGRADPEHPLARDWADTLRSVETSDLICQRALAVGAVDATDPAKRRPYYGTAWLVDAGTGLCITNLHVLLALRQDLGHLFIPGAKPGSFRVRPGVLVDFSRESNRLDRPPFHVVEATASGIDGDGFRRLDLATLRLEPISAEQQLPLPIPVRADMDVPQGRRSFCTIGYPGPPDSMTKSDDRVDWGWVVKTLFGGTFGVKRLAPGMKYRDLGSLADGPERWVFGHDATTLSGSSGSPLLDWTQGGAAVGLHFAGNTLETNVAHALAQCRNRLRALGVPIQDS